MNWEADAQQAADWIQQARSVVVLTGAGVSAESGVPTFRGARGLWRSVDPMSMATPDAFLSDPRGCWAWYRWRQRLVQECAPNDGHRALAELQDLIPSFLLVTQNVDGLHVAAGSRDVVELHGNLFADRCTRCDFVVDSWGETLPNIMPDDPGADPEPPSCPTCGSLLRPGVVWFGESLPEGVMERAAAAAKDADVLLVVGTSGVVYPAAGMAAIAAEGGARVVIVNPNEAAQDGIADLCVRGPSARVLPLLVP